MVRSNIRNATDASNHEYSTGRDINDKIPDRRWNGFNDSDLGGVLGASAPISVADSAVRYSFHTGLFSIAFCPVIEL